MFEKDRATMLYNRDAFTFEEKLYQKYLELRKITSELESIKYSKADTYSTSEDFKQGFIAGVKIMSSILLGL